jgi:hypothetical protein
MQDAMILDRKMHGSICLFLPGAAEGQTRGPEYSMRAQQRYPWVNKYSTFQTL